MYRLCSLLTAFILANTGCTPKAEVENAYFGRFTGVGSGEVVFSQTNSLSRKSENHYGWAVSVKNSPSQIVVKEEIETPTPAQWEIPLNSKTIQLSSDGKTVSATQTIPLKGQTFLFHNWSLSHTDPLGTYTATLFVEGKKVSEVHFIVTE